jgi:hypothetical protein
LIFYVSFDTNKNRDIHGEKAVYTLNSREHNTVVAVARWQDIASLVEKPFVGDWFSVEQERLGWFDKAAYVDENENSLSSALYPDGLVEGFHLLSLLDHLVNKVLFIDDPDWTGWNYGFDSVRFVSMVSIKDRIRVAGTVAAIEPRGERYLVTIDCRIEVEGREKPGMVAVWKVLWTLATEESDVRT